MQGRREVLAVGLVWLVWFGAVLLTVAIGLAAGAYAFAPGWTIHTGLWPLFGWDYNWYYLIAYSGYPDGLGGPQYAFFPLWPQLLRWSGSIPDVVAAGAVAWTASAAAFFGVAEGTPRARLRTALALACWPGSFVLTLAYPDALALAAVAWAAVLAFRGRLLAAGLVGVIAALARPNGVLIALPLAWLARGKGPRAWIGAALPVAGAAAVEAYFWSHSGNARVFFDAQRLWGRGGPGRFGDWTSHLLNVLERHGLLIALLAVLAAAAIVIAWRRFGLWPTAVIAYACAVPLLLAATQSLAGFVNSSRAALVLPLLVILWRLGPLYRPWAAFASAVIGLLLISGTMESFGRQSLFAFPIFWAIAEGPRWLRYPPLAVLGFAANLGLVLLLSALTVGGGGDAVGAELAAVAPAAIAGAVEVDAPAGQRVADAEALPAVRLDRHQQRGGDPRGEPVGEVTRAPGLVGEAPALLAGPELGHRVGEQVVEDLDGLRLGLGLEDAAHPAAQGAHALEVALRGHPRLPLEPMVLEEPAQVRDVAQELGLVVEHVPRVHQADGQVDLPLLQISVVHANFVSSVAV